MRIVKYPYKEGDTKITAPGTTLTELPGGPIDHHWTKSLVASSDGSRSMSASAPTATSPRTAWKPRRDRAAIWQVDRATGRHRIFASGLRNPNGLSFEPQSGALWAVVNERDELGPDLVPDYMTSVKDGAFYGWPYSYYGQHVDPRVQPQRPDLVAKAIAPDYALSSHVAPLGLAFYTGNSLPQAYRGGAFVGEHGSWNRDPLNGYKVVFVPVQQRQAERHGAGRRDRISERRQPGARPPGRACDRQIRRAADRRRCRQHGVARHGRGRWLTGATVGRWHRRF